MNNECKAFLDGVFRGACIGFAIAIGLIQEGIIKL